MRSIFLAAILFPAALLLAAPGFDGASALARTAETSNSGGIDIKATVNGQVLTATLIDNATSRDLVARFPLTVSMMDLYGREMCYRFPEALPAHEAQTAGY